MKTFDWKTIVIAGLALSLGLMLGRGPETARADAATDSNADMIAVTGEYGNGTSVLYLIDTKARQMAVYRSLAGSSVELVAARDIAWDLRIPVLNDRSKAGLSPRDLERGFRRSRKPLTGTTGDGKKDK